MVKANTTIISGDRIYHEGQAVTGLSKVDISWMKKAGYITETGKKEKEKEEADEL